MPLHEDLGIKKTGSFTVYDVGGEKPSVVRPANAKAASGDKKANASDATKATKGKEKVKKEAVKKSEPDPVELTPELQAK